MKRDKKYYLKIFASKILSERFLLKLIFWLRNREHLNLDNPSTFNEKLNWMKLHYRPKELIQWVDKYEVRNYVKEKIGPEYLIPLHGVYTNPNEIVFSDLPESFVLKPTHGAGWVIICKDKNRLDWDACIKEMEEWLKTNFYYQSFEWAYSQIKPRIVCEEFISDYAGEIPKDYKILCFSGEPELVWVDLDRFEDHKRNFYDLDWERLPIEKNYPSSKEEINKPKNLNLMLKIARELSRDLPFCRVDLLLAKDKIIFGEMTFYPEGGTKPFKPKELNVIYGEKININKTV